MKIIKILKGFICKYSFIAFAVISLLIPELLLYSLVEPKVFTESYLKVVTTIFTFSYIFLILFLCIYILPKKVGKVVYAIINSLFLILSFSEYIYHKIFDQFFWLRSILLAGEGTRYASYALEYVDKKLILGVVCGVIFMILALIGWKKPILNGKKYLLVSLIPILSITTSHIYMQPELHNDAMNGWDVWRKPRVVYKNFNDINKTMETTGLYQFVGRSIFSSVFKNNKIDKEKLKAVDEYFAEKEELRETEYTGMFKGKNVIAVMMESIDTWMIDDKYTPTINKMMKEGINFSNYNAPFFGVGFTFSSEFAFNTGFFTPASAVTASNFSKNAFPYSMANLFKEAGYTVNSFHFNNQEFYNRGIMHKGFGYEKYNALTDFGLSYDESQLDSNTARSDEVYNAMCKNQPFFNYFITYSAHVPYVSEDAKLKLIKEKRPDLIDKNMNEEKNNILMLASETDDFFKVLLERLEQDGILEDTVIIAYTDHYAYGVSDENLLKEWKNEDLMYRVPAFIYNPLIKAQNIKKPMMTIDWLPTVVNLFGLARDGKYIGNDVLDEENDGFVLFETWGWMDENMYYDPASSSNENLDAEYINKQNERVKQSIEVNDSIVLYDYYKNREKLK